MHYIGLSGAAARTGSLRKKGKRIVDVQKVRVDYANKPKKRTREIGQRIIQKATRVLRKEGQSIYIYSNINIQE